MTENNSGDKIKQKLRTRRDNITEGRDNDYACFRNYDYACLENMQRLNTSGFDVLAVIGNISYILKENIGVGAAETYFLM